VSSPDVAATPSASMPSGVVAGIFLIVTSLVVIFAMAHHPTGGESAHIVKTGALSNVVHGTMIAAMVALLFGFTVLCARLGLKHSLVLLGLIAYGIGIVAHLGAALINGFVVVSMASRYIGAESAELQVLRQLMSLTWSLTQALAGLGAIAIAAAMTLWSVHLLRLNPLARIAGILGLALGIAPVAAYVGGVLQMNVTGAFIVYAAQGAWAFAIGAMLLTKRL
jgi:hypothetical protein